ncbi:unnamed protein product [Caenorhabditis bovis]|uniref:Uncharacterized protein n=1 Tax=Caenorhabditis bovis TaxID=2654633 RepID=A0A8S1EKF6_9PELO|nr:unnamed protein product [Caenorhabditis bovis]
MMAVLLQLHLRLHHLLQRNNRFPWPRQQLYNQENAPLLGSDSGTERQMNPSDPGKSENSNRPGASSIPAKSGTGVLRICMIINAIVIILLVPFWVLIILCGLQFITIDFMENLMNSIGGLI